MGKRKKHNATTEPRESPDLPTPTHSDPTTSTLFRKRRRPRDPTPGAADSEPDDTSPPSSPGSVRRLLEPYSKPRLLAILAEAAASDPALRARLATAADASPSHRRLFVHGLPPHADAAALAEAFSRFGALADDCHAVADRATGRCRGYGFVSFASRAAARRALRESAPGVAVAGRPVSAQFASAGLDPTGGGGAGRRRVYVTNVAPDASAERLRAFFARFGELEGGPFGFDGETGRSRGYALFVYRAAAGAGKAVEEPHRVFEGRTLHCQHANEPARKAKAPPAAVVEASAPVMPPPAPVVEAPALRPVLDAIAAAGAGDLETYVREPEKAAALLGQNPALAAAALSAALASAAVASPSPAVTSVAPSPAAASKLMPVALVPSPVNIGVRPSADAGLLGPYKPPSSPLVSSSSSPGRKGTMLG
ncbi:hypothetical protein HU200_034568 [Digitaria exilis]|uniref:RRM domain-containing protein n=1 Tax=Digitaria exilis TaxID=1010633 RepID=A0A835BHP2_9POAL|nr:hypothetical protein HU200_034568 [Digitaria exilis]